MTRTGYFARAKQFVDNIVYQAEAVTLVSDAVARVSPDLIRKCGRAQLACGPSGSPCSAACHRFDPGVSCTYSRLDNSTYTPLVGAFWTFRSNKFIEWEHWDLFYRCFHRSDKKDDGKVRFVKKFPNDIALMRQSMAESNFRATAQLPDTDIGKWTSERLAAVSMSDLDHRMASTDWDWNWYSSCGRRNLVVSLQQAEMKVKLDKLLHGLYGDAYENTGTYTVSKTDPLYPQIEGLYRNLKPLLTIEIVFTLPQ